jgi:hypothetical protein
MDLGKILLILAIMNHEYKNDRNPQLPRESYFDLLLIKHLFPP